MEAAKELFCRARTSEDWEQVARTGAILIQKGICEVPVNATSEKKLDVEMTTLVALTRDNVLESPGIESTLAMLGDCGIFVARLLILYRGRQHDRQTIAVLSPSIDDPRIEPRSDPGCCAVGTKLYGRCGFYCVESGRIFCRECAVARRAADEMVPAGFVPVFTCGQRIRTDV